MEKTMEKQEIKDNKEKDILEELQKFCKENNLKIAFYKENVDQDCYTNFKIVLRG